MVSYSALVLILVLIAVLTHLEQSCCLCTGDNWALLSARVEIWALFYRLMVVAFVIGAVVMGTMTYVIWRFRESHPKKEKTSLQPNEVHTTNGTRTLEWVYVGVVVVSGFCHWSRRMERWNISRRCSRRCPSRKGFHSSTMVLDIWAWRWKARAESRTSSRTFHIVLRLLH